MALNVRRKRRQVEVLAHTVRSEKPLLAVQKCDRPSVTSCVKPPAPSLTSSALVLTELLSNGYEAYLRISVAARQGGRAKVATRDLETLLGLIIPDLMVENQGVDGDLAWWLALLQLERRRGAIEERTLVRDPSAREVFESSRLYRAFLGRLATSPAGLTWGHLETRIPRTWS